MRPKKIGVITSPTGAAIHDILNVSQRRFPNLPVDIVPVKVQGRGAAEEIVSALGLLEERNDVDVIILGRGGGSLEDLQAFNDESVARAVFHARIPVVSAVGHETDVSIVDFVSDLRAPTPSAAAEMVVPVKRELVRAVEALTDSLVAGCRRAIDLRRSRLVEWTGRLRDPRKRIQDTRLRLDELSTRLAGLIHSGARRKRQLCQFWKERLYANNPKVYTSRMKERVDYLMANNIKNYGMIINKKRHLLGETASRLDALNPMAVLSRGYSITRTVPEAVVVKGADQVNDGQMLEIILGKGTLTAKVDTRTVSHGKKTNV
jgi:exodeoxyribonuclease VII large subunit